jgi:hypothetical protein
VGQHEVGDPKIEIKKPSFPFERSKDCIAWETSLGRGNNLSSEYWEKFGMAN